MHVHELKLNIRLTAMQKKYGSLVDMATNQSSCGVHLLGSDIPDIGQVVIWPVLLFKYWLIRGVEQFSWKLKNKEIKIIHVVALNLKSMGS